MTKERLLSLDVFRGFTILLMTVVNNPGSWASVYPPLLHAEWHGCTPTDLVFPFFIFILGVAIPFAMPDRIFNASTLLKITTRSLRIFCLGFFLFFFKKIELFGLEGIPLLLVRLAITIGVTYALLGNFSTKVKAYATFSVFLILMLLAYNSEMFKDVRIPGVLQRIGIVYFVVSILYLKTTTRTQIIAAILLLLGYWASMSLIPVPGIGAPNFEKGTNFAAWIDSISLPNHMYAETKTWDPEGVLSTLPAIASGIIGLLIGSLLNLNLTKVTITKRMFIIGVILTAIGFAWGLAFPINKALWSSSYVLYTAGIATICLSALYYIIEIANLKKWTKLFLIWGVNPMIVFFFSGVVPRVLSMIEMQHPEKIAEKINLQNYLYQFWIVPHFDNPMNASLAGALTYVAIWSFILWIFYRNKLIFKV
jgi:predicted acyltransferase